MRKPLLAAALVLSACIASCKKQEHAEFRFINRNDIITQDLNQMSYMQDFRLANAIREGLYTNDPATMMYRMRAA